MRRQTLAATTLLRYELPTPQRVGVAPTAVRNEKPRNLERVSAPVDASWHDPIYWALVKI